MVVTASWGQAVEDQAGEGSGWARGSSAGVTHQNVALQLAKTVPQCEPNVGYIVGYSRPTNHQLNSQRLEYTEVPISLLVTCNGGGLGQRQVTRSSPPGDQVGFDYKPKAEPTEDPANRSRGVDQLPQSC